MTITISNTVLYYLILSVVIMIPYVVYTARKVKRQLSKIAKENPTTSFVLDMIKNMDSFKKLKSEIYPSCYIYAVILIIVCSPITFPICVIGEVRRLIKKMFRNKKQEPEDNTQPEINNSLWDILDSGELAKPEDCGCKIGANITISETLGKPE